MKHEPPHLFRPEVREAQSLGWMGRPVVIQSLPFQLSAVVSLLLVAAAVLMITFGHYARRVRVEGIMMPLTGISRIASPQNGWISKQWVNDGDKVFLGQPLYTLRLDITASSGSTEEAVIALLREKRGVLRADLGRQDAINREKKAGLEHVRQSVEAEGRLIDDQIALASEHVDLLKAMADKQKANLKRGFAKDSDYEPRLQNVMSQQAQIKQLMRDRAEIETRLQDTLSQLASFDLNAASELSKMKQEIIDVEQRLSESEAKWEITLTAPRDGTVTALIGHVGQTVSSGAPLLSVLPEGDPLSAQLLVPSSAIGFVKEGQRVLMRYDSFPYQKFGQYRGVVAAISGTTLSGEEMQVSGLGTPEAGQREHMYRVTVHPDQPAVLAYGKLVSIQPGMKLEASILADARPLYQWILDPLYSLGRATSTDGLVR
ncbi:HlyD family efflux transporter periplasmic adaptor subunit (plasmid) [Agrobacterium vitis]|uniref:HlyD family secretion protein n=1 Tax=Agrobacterium vitis TaxID=373 RepID=UPI0018D24A8E|nr:HlyD family efflux transporter periplasmic adaptor subunit [Agrobacterium vitis]